MSALDPVVSARPAYLPTGPREEYRGERPRLPEGRGATRGCHPSWGAGIDTVAAGYHRRRGRSGEC